MGRRKSNSVTTGPISRHFCFSGFGPYADYKAELVYKLIDLGAIYYESEVIPLKCTHLICIQPSKNKKFLGACAAGLWVLSLSYIQDSHKAKNWLLESDYELGESSCDNDKSTLSFIHLAPKRCRLKVQLTGAGIFDGWVSVVISHKKKRKSSYKSILKLGGSRIKEVSSPITSTKSFDKEVTHIFVDKYCHWSIEPLLKLKILCLNADYIRNFLLQDPAPDPEEFAVTTYIPNSDAVGVLELGKVKTMPTKKLIPIVEGRVTWPLPKLPSPGNKKKLSYDSCETSNETKKLRLSGDIKRSRCRPRKNINGGRTTIPFGRKLGDTKCCSAGRFSLTGSPTASGSRVRFIQPSIEEFFKLRPCTVKLLGSDMINATEFVVPNEKLTTKDNGESKACVNSEGGDSEEIFVEKENVGPFHRTYLIRGLSQRCSPSNSLENEVRKPTVMMPPAIVNMFDVWSSEDGEFMKSVQFIKSVISERWYPPPSVISSVILSILSDPGNTALEKECVAFLSDLLFIHPPLSFTIKELYLEALCLNKSGFLRKPWEAVAEIIQRSISLKKKNTGLLSFVVDLFQEDFLHFLLTTTRSQCDSILKRSSDLLVCAVLWTKKDLGKVNHCCRELLNFYGETVKDDELYEVQMLLQRLITLVAECFRLSDSPKMGADSLASRCEEFAKAFVQSSLDLNSNSSFELRKCLSSLKPPWLRRHVSEILLHQLASSHWKVTNQSRCACLKDIVTIYLKSPDLQNGDQVVRKECFETNGKYVIRPEIVNKSNCKGETTLHIACAGNRVNRVKELLKVPGIDVNIKDLAGWTPLHEAANHGNTECIKVLLEWSASTHGSVSERMKVDVHATNNDGITALHDAVINNHVDVARVLLQYGGEKLLNMVSLSGYIALDMAENEEMVMLLKSPLPKLQKSSVETTPCRRRFVSPLSDEQSSKYLLLVINFLDSYFDQNHTKHMASALKKLSVCSGEGGVTSPETRTVQNLVAEFFKYEPNAADVLAVQDDLHIFQKMDYFVKCLIERLEPFFSNRDCLKNDIDLLRLVTSC